MGRIGKYAGALSLVIAAGCAHDPIDKKLPPVEVEEPLSPEALRERFQPGWERGTTWMVKSRCYPVTPKRDPYPTALLDAWPSYAHFEVVASTSDAFVVSRTILSDAMFSWARRQQLKPERFLVRRNPFGLADKLPRHSDDTDLGTASEPWANGPCPGSNFTDGSCPPLPAVPHEEQAATTWPIRQAARPTPNGVQFIYWEAGGWPSALEWRSGEPYWEDSRGCSRLLRNLDGSVYRPGSSTELPATEPRVAMIVGTSSIPKTVHPAPEGTAWASLVAPRWQVGDTWATQHRCPNPSRTYAQGGTWRFGWAPTLAAELSTFAFYEVVEETLDAYIITESKASWRGAPLRRYEGAGPSSPYESEDLSHVFRKKPFGLVRWGDRSAAAEYGGGPCLNVGPNVDRCPFPMPADPPADGSQPSWWFAKQTVRRTAGGLELDYVSPDKTELTIRWKDGEPWPEASPSCTKLLRNPDGTVLRPGDVSAFLDRWEETPEFKEELRAASEWRPSKMSKP